jgi:HEAT repeat protein
LAVEVYGALTAPLVVRARRTGFEPRLRAAAAYALARVGGPESVPALVTALLGDEFAFVREAALTALAVIGGEESLRAIQAACADSEPRVRQAAASVLAAATLSHGL